MRVLSTKILLPNQRELLLNAGLHFVEYNAITLNPVVFDMPNYVSHAIISSQQGAKQLLANSDSQAIENFFCVGEKTAALLIQKGLNVAHTSANGAALGYYITAHYSTQDFHYFCGNMRRDELPDILENANIICHEIIVYETTLNSKKIPGNFDGVLCYSPSGVDAFANANRLSNTIAFCIGETTAARAKLYTEQVVIANSTRIESVIAKAAKTLK